MIVEVTQSDIDNGQREEAGSCPIAHAIRRTIGATEVVVDAYGVTASLTDGGVVTFNMPPTGEQFIEDFDEGSTVYPLTLDLTETSRFDPNETWSD